MGFNAFDRLYHRSETMFAAANGALGRYGRSMPRELLLHWKESGFCSYASGLFFTVDPDTLKDAIEDWTASQGGTRLPIVRTAFGQIFYLRRFEDGYDISLLDALRKKSVVCTQNINTFFNGFLCNEKIIDKVLRKPLVERARKKLGEIGPEECYAFEPALAIGGSEDVKNMRKVKLAEHLDMLRQM